eukprot:1599171-Rhodomonas_salina.2
MRLRLVEQEGETRIQSGPGGTGIWWRGVTCLCTPLPGLQVAVSPLLAAALSPPEHVRAAWAREAIEPSLPFPRARALPGAAPRRSLAPPCRRRGRLRA